MREKFFRYIKGEYTEEEIACIEQIVKLYSEYMEGAIPDIFNISEDKKAIKLDSRSFENTHWYALCPQHELGSICYDAITHICKYQSERVDSVVARSTGIDHRIYHDDPRALLSHSVKQWFAALANMTIDLSVISRIESYMSFIQALWFSNIFEPSSSTSMRLTLLEIYEILESRIIPCVKRKLEQQSAKERLDQMIALLEQTINASVFYTYYVAHEDTIINKSIKSLTEELESIKIGDDGYNFVKRILQKLLLHEGNQNREKRVTHMIKLNSSSILNAPNHPETSSDLVTYWPSADMSLSNVASSSSSSSKTLNSTPIMHESLHDSHSGVFKKDNTVLAKEVTINFDENPFLIGKNVLISSELRLSDELQQGLYQKLIDANKDFKENLLYLGGYLYELQKAIYVLKKAAESARLGGDLLIYGFFRDLLNYFLSDLIDLIKKFEIVFSKIKECTINVLKGNIRNSISLDTPWQKNFENGAMFYKEVLRRLTLLYSTINEFISLANSKSFDGLLLEMQDSAISFSQDAFYFTRNIRLKFEKPPVALSQSQQEKIGFITNISSHSLSINTSKLMIGSTSVAKAERLLGMVCGLLKSKQYEQAEKILRSIPIEDLTESCIRSDYLYIKAKLLRKLNIKNIALVEELLNEAINLKGSDDHQALFEIKIELIIQLIHIKTIDNLKKAIKIKEELSDDIYFNLNSVKNRGKLEKVSFLIQKTKDALLEQEEKIRADLSTQKRIYADEKKSLEMVVEAREKKQKNSKKKSQTSFFSQVSNAENSGKESSIPEQITTQGQDIAEEIKKIEEYDQKIRVIESAIPPVRDDKLEAINDSEKTPLFQPKRPNSQSDWDSSNKCCRIL